MESSIAINGVECKIQPFHDFIMVSKVDITEFMENKIGNIQLVKPLYFNPRIYNLGKIEKIGGLCRPDVKEGDIVYFGNLGTYEAEIPDKKGIFKEYTFIKDAHILCTLQDI